MKKIWILLLFIILHACASTGDSISAPIQQPAQQQEAAPTQQPVQQQKAAPQPASPFWTGDGGRGRSLAILAPKATGLAANQGYIPSLVQGEFVSNFTGFSAISVLDRQRLDEQYAELLSGYYSDNAQEGWDLGHLSPTDYIMGGNITKTNTGFAIQMSITKSADKITVASYSGTCTIDELTNLSGVRRASLDLLQKMGVAPTERTRTELAGGAAENHVNAQTALARGIAAQQLGNTAETLAQFYQATAYDPTLAEAAARANTISASVRTGSMGANIRNDIAWRDEWVKILADANITLQNIPLPKPPVFPQQITVAQIIAPEPKFREGAIDYTARTAQLSVDFYAETSLIFMPYPKEYLTAYDAYQTAFTARSDVYNKIVNDLNAGLRATRRNDAWKLTELSAVKRNSDKIYPRSGDVTVIARTELLNDEGQIIGNSGNAYTLGRFSFGDRSTTLIQTADIRQFVFTVKADDITDQMSLRITASTTPAQNNQIQVMTYTEFLAARPDVLILNRVTSIKNGEFMGKGISFIIIPNSVTSIGGGAFRDNRLTSVTVPNSVTSIGGGAFASNQLTSVTIPNSVTSIGSEAFYRNQLTSVTIPNSVTSIEDFTFSNNQLTSVIIPNRVTTIGVQAFNQNQLTSVTIPNSVTSIGGAAFSSNRLTSVTIPNSVTTIGVQAFSSNYQLSSVTIPNSVTSIGSKAFSSNQLSSVTIGANVKLGLEGGETWGNTFDNGLDDFYANNGRKAGTYTRSDNKWSYSPR